MVAWLSAATKSLPTESGSCEIMALIPNIFTPWSASTAGWMTPGGRFACEASSLDEWIEARRGNAADYDELFREAGLLGRVQVPVELPMNRHIFHQYVIRCRKRDELRAALQSRASAARFIIRYRFTNRSVSKTSAMSPRTFRRPTRQPNRLWPCRFTPSLRTPNASMSLPALPISISRIHKRLHPRPGWPRYRGTFRIFRLCCGDGESRSQENPECPFMKQRWQGRDTPISTIGSGTTRNREENRDVPVELSIISFRNHYAALDRNQGRRAGRLAASPALVCDFCSMALRISMVGNGVESSGHRQAAPGSVGKNPRGGAGI